MTREELDEVGEYAVELWPKFSLTAAQREMWYHKMRWHTSHDARKALGEAYANGRWKEPTLADVLAAIRSLSRMNVNTKSDFSPQHIDQVRREEREDDELLKDWTPEEIAAGKAEIIRNEPSMAVMDAMGASGAFWRHFIVERYVFNRAAIIGPDGLVSHIDRDAYWSKK